MAVVFTQNLWVRIPKTLPNSYLHYNEEAKEFYIFFLDELLLWCKFMNAFGWPVRGIVRVTRDGDFTVDLEEEDTESIPDIVRSG